MDFMLYSLVIFIIAPICILASILNWDWYFRKLVKPASQKGSSLRRRQRIIHFIIPLVIVTFILYICSFYY
ncbi:hypothetical protein Bccel_0065 [Pseudobacteroides cellulosolvens ATCC 35603 = DSM 2933]|uniref:Uncharacterized protein n=1 Tax=Pseudobacteroides cellulosolvens ATCC 35603 = DSM 2933 TaxID=398512 RepID=A0A0L6JGH0_9FIRM|nr:hypothetical protein Bccel_0065 [Pseudobacteroides cellulosolvens ATCC 35603 = DSM 2933]